MNPVAYSGVLFVTGLLGCGDATTDPRVVVPDAGELSDSNVSECVTQLADSGGACFSSPIEYRAQDGAQRLVAADVDSDGALDLVSTHGDLGLCLFWGEGRGAFSSCKEVPLEAAAGLNILDLDHYGGSDLVVGRSSDILPLWNANLRAFDEGEGISSTSSKPSLAPSLFDATGDFDEDGDEDMLVGAFSGVRLLKNSGTRMPMLTADFLGPYGQIGDVVVSDFDNDGAVDFMVSNASSLQLVSGDGTGAFADPIAWGGADAFAYRLASSDLDLDGHKDIVAIYSDRYLRVMLGDSSDHSITEDAILVEDIPRDLAVGFFNSDIFPDIVIAKTDDSLAVFLGEGNGLFGAASNMSLRPGGRGPVSIVASDFNSDGLDDLASINLISGTLSVVLSSP